jgi:hypothetical protein
MVITETADAQYENRSKITKLLVKPLEWAATACFCLNRG